MILDEIIRHTNERVAALDGVPVQQGRPHEQVSLEEAILSADDRNAVIAEIKFASPTAGRIREDAEVETLAGMLAGGGCTALSVLTEPSLFAGSIDYPARVKAVTDLPVLRKDFIIDERQLYETVATGADAVLLITRLLGTRLPGFLDLAHSLGLEAVVEVHDEAEVLLALEAGARLIGINNRDLGTMEIDPGTTERLSPLVHDAGRLVIAESGITSVREIRRLKGHADAFLIGTAVMSARDPGKAVEGFVFA